MTLNKPTVLKQHGHLVSPSIADWKSKLEGVCVCVYIHVSTAAAKSLQSCPTM